MDWCESQKEYSPCDRDEARRSARSGPSSLNGFAHIVNAGRTWNWHVLVATVAMLRPGRPLYDIGANIGFISLEVAAFFRDSTSEPKVQVIAFEPLPALADVVRESAGVNGLGNVSVRGEVVSDAESEAVLFLGSHSIHASTSVRESRSRTLACRTARIDALVASGAIPPPTAINIDFEGGELAGFRGASETVSGHSPAILSESAVNSTRVGYERHDILALLSSLGPYRFLKVADADDYMEPLDMREPAATSPGDILATTASDSEIAAMSAGLGEWASAQKITVGDKP